MTTQSVLEMSDKQLRAHCKKIKPRDRDRSDEVTVGDLLPLMFQSTGCLYLEKGFRVCSLMCDEITNDGQQIFELAQYDRRGDKKVYSYKNSLIACLELAKARKLLP